MPITIKHSEGLFTKETAQEVFKRVSDLFLAHNGATGNGFITPNLIGDVIAIPKGLMFSGSEPDTIVEVQCKVPTFALAETSIRKAFVADATDAILELATKELRRERVYINLVYGSRMWGIGGVVYNDEELQVEIEKAPML